MAHRHPYHLIPAPSNTRTTVCTTSSPAKARTRAQSTTRVSSASHAAGHATRVPTTDQSTTSRHRWLSLMFSATTRESGHEPSSAAATIGHAGIDALLVALLVASVAFAGAETHCCLLLCNLVCLCVGGPCRWGSGYRQYCLLIVQSIESRTA